MPIIGIRSECMLFYLVTCQMPNTIQAMQDFYTQAATIHKDVIAWRRDFHRNPELAFEEIRTAGVVAKQLESLGMEVQAGVAKTGVIGILEGDHDGPTVMVRYDMDALPIQEENAVEYASSQTGIMHACGHDGHTAIGLGVARILSQHKANIRGRIKFVFQPAEETGYGARMMIDDGALKHPSPDVFIGLHLWTDFPVGQVAIPVGASMAGADTFTVTIEGHGSHGALPHLSSDPVVCMVQTISSLQTIVSRNLDPLETAVVSVTQFQGSRAVNVIPDEITFAGTLRTFKPDVRARVIERMKTITSQTAAAFNCDAVLTVEQLSLPIVNDEDVSNRVAARVVSTLPAVDVERHFRVMAAEDAAFFMAQVPGVFIMVGAANDERGLNYPHHHPRFDFDEEALVNGVAVMAAAISEFVMP